MIGDRALALNESTQDKASEHGASKRGGNACGPDPIAIARRQSRIQLRSSAPGSAFWSSDVMNDAPFPGPKSKRRRKHGFCSRASFDPRKSTKTRNTTDAQALHFGDAMVILAAIATIIIAAWHAIHHTAGLSEVATAPCGEPCLKILQASHPPEFWPLRPDATGPTASGSPPRATSNAPNAEALPRVDSAHAPTQNADLRNAPSTIVHRDVEILHLARPGPAGTTIIEIAAGRARCLRSPGVQRICERSGWLTNPGDTAISLPNRLRLQIVDPAQSFDAIHH